MRLGEVIKEFREKEGISQREFARRCELSNSLISIIEMGVNPQTGKPMEPDMRTYRQLASGMGLSTRQLDEKLRTGTVPQDKTLSDLSPEDLHYLEALHQDPQLRMMFDRVLRMSQEDKDRMFQISGIMKGELYGE